MVRLLMIPVALIALLCAAMAWSGGGVTRRAEFAFINRGDIITLDLNQMSYLQDFRLTYGIREGLYGLDPKTYRPIKAGVVEDPTVSSDKKVWTFKLNPNSRWTNGDPVTAKDYIFSWRRMLEDPGEYTYLFGYFKNANKYVTDYQDYLEALRKGTPTTRPSFADVGIKELDPYTLEVTLEDPVPYLPDVLAFPPFYPRNERSMEKFKEVDPVTGHATYRPEYTRPPDVVTNGPFELKHWDFKRRLWLEKSPTYWDKDNVNVNTIEMVVNENPLSQFLQYEAGTVDWQADVPGDLAAELRSKGRTDLKSAPAFGTAFLTFYVGPKLPANVPGTGEKNPLADERVRQALTMAIDKQPIVRDITRMGEQIATTYVPPDGTLPGYTSKPGLPFDVARAKKLLADAGYPDGKDFPSLPLLFNTSSQDRTKIVQVIKDQWRKNLNINVDLVGLETKVYRNRVTEKEYAIAIVAWYGDYPDASTFTDKYLSWSKQNDCAWANKKYDDLCVAATKEPDERKRLDMLQDAEEILNTEAPIVPLYYYVNVGIVRDGIDGCRPNSRNLTVFKGITVTKPAG